MRVAFAAVALVALSVAPAVAQDTFDDPRALIEAVYAPYLRDELPENQVDLFSPTLLQLWEAALARSVELEEPVIDFDPFINGQDFQLSDFVIADPAIEGGTATVAVSFTNLGQPTDLRYTLVETGEGWKIDDVEALGEFSYRLSALLADDPLLN